MPSRLQQNDSPSESRTGGPLATYLRALRARRLFVAVAVLAAIAGHLVWLAVSTPRYAATAQLLVNPVSADDESFLGLPVLRETDDDPTRAVETAATLLYSPEAADRTARTLGLRVTAQRILDVVSLEPQGQSNVVAVTATADTPGQAARVANTFARSALAERATALQQAATAQLRRVEAQLAALGTASTPDVVELRQRVSTLRSLRDGGDPSIALSQPARPPGRPSRPPLAITLLPVALVGFLIASGAAVARELAGRRVRDEEEAVALYPLPVLARVPLLNNRQVRAMRGPSWSAPPTTREAFRMLLAQLEHRDGGSVVMITSASAGDGKTTAAINLAAAAAESGDRVILLDFDLRKPEVGDALGISHRTPVASLAEPRFGLGEGLVPAMGVSNLSLLSPQPDDDSHPLVEAAKRRLPALIEEARAQADWVIIDTPPLGLVSDALGVIRAVDHVVIVARPGVTDRKSLRMMRDVLERTYEPGPTGLVVVTKRGGPPRGLDGYGYGYGAASQPAPLPDASAATSEPPGSGGPVEPRMPARRDSREAQARQPRPRRT